MEKKLLHLGLHSGQPPYTSEKAVRAQWNHGPKVLGPSIATTLAQRSKETKVAKPSESNPPD